MPSLLTQKDVSQKLVDCSRKTALKQNRLIKFSKFLQKVKVLKISCSNLNQVNIFKILKFADCHKLRAEDVGANFGADLMRNAYDFYNSITETERDILSSIFKRVFKIWHDHTVNPEQEYEILAKVYRVNSTLAERLGANLSCQCWCCNQSSFRDY